jgi:hypothetical protein
MLVYLHVQTWVDRVVGQNLLYLLLSTIKIEKISIRWGEIFF